MQKTTLNGGAAAPPDEFDSRFKDAGVVAFDFDGTLTVRDSFTTFLKWRVTPARHRAGLVRLIPAALAYLGNRDRGRIKAAAVREFLMGMTRDDIEAEARAFAQSESTRLLRPDALRSWRYWRQRNVRLVIVSASPDVVVAPFARGLGADALIATRLAYDDRGFVTGALDGQNCRGPEKVRRLEAMFGEGLRLVAAYGDTAGDREMLAIADHAGYREFRERP